MRFGILMVVTLGAVVPAAAAQPTAFSYQGRLTAGATPAQGAHDLQFRLFDAPTGGAQLGPTLCFDNVTVADGLFALLLDFGPQFATPAQRHLEITVRADSGQGCANTAGYVTLAPRQAFTPAPLASHARSAFALDAPDGSPASAVVVDNDGRVGMGTLAPAKPLHVDGANGLFIGRDPGAGGFTGLALSLSSLSGGHAEIQAIRSSGSAFGNLALNPLGGNVGIGTTAAAAALHVLKEPAGPGGTLALAGVTHTFLSFFPHGQVSGRKGFVGFASAFTPNLTLASESPGSRVVLTTTSGSVFAAGGIEEVRIVRGIFAANGTTIAGTGFSVAHLAQGSYRITFNQPFPAPPAVKLTADVTCQHCPWVLAATEGVTGSIVNVELRRGVNKVDAPVHFVAIGVR